MVMVAMAARVLWLFGKLKVLKFESLKVLQRQLFMSLEDWKYLHFNLCSGTETEEGFWKELQFSLVDNSKLSVVYLFNKSLKRLFHLYKVYTAGKRLLYIKRNKAISLEKGTEVKDLILTSYKAGGLFLSLVKPEAASLPLVGVGLSTSQPSPYTVEDGIGTHNPWKTVFGVTYLH
ncbi:hypothetical protein Tco_0291329 [Tanacetum coccineum]